MLNSDKAYLVLRIKNDKAIPLTILAKLFDALSADYGRAKGGHLGIEAFREGCLLALLYDLSDFADKSNHLFEFCRNLISLVGGVLAGTMFITSRRDSNAKTVFALADAALKSEGLIELSYHGPQSERLRLKITPKEAAVINERGVQTPLARSRSASPDLSQLENLAKEAVFTRSLENAEAAEGPAEQMRSLLFDLLKIVKALPGGEQSLKALVHRLRSEGHSQAAAIISSLS